MALLKKRALAKLYTQTDILTDGPLTKKLSLLKKPQSSSAATFLSLLENCKGSNEALQLLIKVSEILSLQEEDVPISITRLSKHFLTEEDSVVRAKILSLLGDIGQEHSADTLAIIEEVLILIKNENSHKVISQAIYALSRLGQQIPSNLSLHQRLVEVAKEKLKDTDIKVKIKCLSMIAELTPSTMQDFHIKIIRLVSAYCYSEDPRVRDASFSALERFHQRSIDLPITVYYQACKGLEDDYEIVRLPSLRIICVFGQTQPETLIYINPKRNSSAPFGYTSSLTSSTGSNSPTLNNDNISQEIRLVDDAFRRTCLAIMDLSRHVRTCAANLLGQLKNVGHEFLMQTLDKKMLNSMKLGKRNNTEQSWSTPNLWKRHKNSSNNYSSAFNDGNDSLASGFDDNRNMDDRYSGPAGGDTVLGDESVSLISSVACGAIIHGLEDEYMEVRTASIDTVTKLATNNEGFAKSALDFLVDMFNDEIDTVRKRAVDSLAVIGHNITLGEEQIETILGAIKDCSYFFRESLHKVLATCKLANTRCLQRCIESVLDNLKRYPTDKRCTWRCLQRLGQQHPQLTLPLVTQLLEKHPYIDTPEAHIDDPQYVGILILLFNAAEHCPTLIQHLTDHSTFRHYDYLRALMPGLVPNINWPGRSPRLEMQPVSMNTIPVLETILTRLNSASSVTRDFLVTEAINNIEVIGQSDPIVEASSQFIVVYLRSQQLATKLINNPLWSNPTALNFQHGFFIRNGIADLLHNCCELQYLFIEQTRDELGLVMQLKLKALALQLMYIVKVSNSSALALCEHFLGKVEETQRFLLEYNCEPDKLTQKLFNEMESLEDTKPGPVVRPLLDILRAAPMIEAPRVNSQLKRSSASILEPAEELEKPLKFTAGLMVGVPLVAELFNIRLLNLVHVRIRYPDQNWQLMRPRNEDIHPLDLDSRCDWRLETTVLITHQYVWTEAAPVELSLVLDASEFEAASSTMALRRMQAANASTKTFTEPWLVALSKPVKVCVSPKPIKRGI